MIDGAVSSGEPVHSDNPGPMQKTGQANGRVTPKVTSHNLGDGSKGVEGSINNKGSSGRGSPFKR